MIKHISTSDKWIIASWPTNPTTNNIGAGPLRYNQNAQGMEVWDGYSWSPIEQTASLKMSADADRILRWAEEKMIQEEYAKMVAKDYPIVQDALDKIKAAEEELAVALALVAPIVS